MYRLIACDMDGTLLDDNDVLSEENLEAIKKAEEKDAHFVFASGRNISGLTKFIRDTGIKGPVITCNGGVIFDSEHNVVLYQQKMNSEDAKKAIELAAGYDTTMAIWSDENLYTNKLNDRFFRYEKHFENKKGVLLREFCDDTSQAEGLPSLEGLLEKGINKILCYDSDEKIAQMKNDFGTLVEKGEWSLSESTFATSSSCYLEFFHKDVSKGAALEKIGELYGVERDEMIAIGDGMNDYSMIKYAGLGAVMKNADNNVFAVANYIAPSNNESGVADVIRRFVLSDNVPKKTAILTRYKDNDCRFYVKGLSINGYCGETVDEVADATDYSGLIVAGGIDIDPFFFGQENNGSEEIDVDFDKRSFRTVEAFANQKKPILGICRGIQVINVFFGGTLIQDVPRHRIEIPGTHPVRADGSCIKNGIASDEKQTLNSVYNVNSRHHQVADIPGGDFYVAARSEEGYVEAIIHKTLPVFGVQWHPERMLDEPDNPAGIGVFASFAELLKKIRK